MNTNSMRFTDPDNALLGLLRALRETGYGFITPTPETHRRVNARPENRCAETVADVFGWSRPFRRDVLPAGIFDLAQAAGILAEHDQGWRARLRISWLDDNLFLHSAYPTLDEDAVFFGPDTYRFATAIRSYFDRDLAAQPRRIADIGCGSGAGAVVAAKLAEARAPDAKTIMLDINDGALRLARINAQAAGLPELSARNSNLLSGVDGDFDLVIANPPYLLDQKERLYRHGGEPLGAGLSLAIIDAALPRLKPGGTLLLYTGSVIVRGHDGFRAEAERRLAQADVGFTYVETDPDVFGEELDTRVYSHSDRIAAVVLTATRP